MAFVSYVCKKVIFKQLIMKKSGLLAAVLFFIGFAAFGQTKTVTGKIKEVKPYNDEYRLTINDTSYVLIVDARDASKKSFEVNKKYKDILVKSKEEYDLNPKYANKNLKVTYYINGKGWRCIKTIEPSK
jgi:hypothetical protein